MRHSVEKVGEDEAKGGGGGEFKKKGKDQMKYS